MSRVSAVHPVGKPFRLAPSCGASIPRQHTEVGRAVSWRMGVPWRLTLVKREGATHHTVRMT